ncbi:MAG: nucleoside triphosphate pyrophosphohydrolase [Chloroflexi bacterium]|nr:nucleoside triphosphate pyrophosphohydrolase [Chloroflexota bacterium]
MSFHSKSNFSKFQTLERIIAKLRAPDGCPWDREQTHDSLKGFLLEECYEVLEALDRKDAGKLSEELGDLLLQIVLHAQIAKEADEFTMGDVVRGISQKLVRRHPHVFGDVKVAGAKEVEANWEALKQAEKGKASVLDGIPKAMPALAYSQTMHQRAAATGFDWKDVDSVLEKVQEELAEFKGAVSLEEKEKELGDVLAALVNVGRKLGIDMEGALRKANHRFYQRFTAMERLCKERGLVFSKLTLDEMNALWEEVKALERG